MFKGPTRIVVAVACVAIGALAFNKMHDHYLTQQADRYTQAFQMLEDATAGHKRPEPAEELAKND